MRRRLCRHLADKCLPMQQCPKCKSEDVHRSRAKSRWEQWRKEITGKRPYRCQACGWRGWGPDMGPKFDDVEREMAERALAPDPPNLKAAGFGREEQKDKEIKLKELDGNDRAPV